MDIIIRKEKTEDYFETEAMTRRAFYNVYNPGCDEHLLVNKLRMHEDYLSECSRIAVVDGCIAGTIMYFKSVIHTEDADIIVASFGPLCVDHKYKNMGIGKKLLEETIPLVKEAGYPGILIFGEPDYYPRYGFKRAREFGITDMEGNAPDPFMGLELIEGALHIDGGKFEESSVCEELTDEALEEIEKKFPSLKKIARPCQWGYENAYDDREGYHYVYATHCPSVFEQFFKKYVQKEADILLKKIWESLDMTPYVLYAGDVPIGIFVTVIEEQPTIEYMFMKENVQDAKRIQEEVVNRFLESNRRVEMKEKMKCDKYKEYFTKEYMMGPNSLRLLDEIISDNPEAINRGNVLDLGCGAALTSVFLGKETNADRVYALDLWISATDNYQRIVANELEDKVIPIHGDALNLPFSQEYFDVIVSIDTYHYFGMEENLFADKILPFLKKEGYALIVVPGVKKDPEGDLKKLMEEWAQEEAANFRTAEWWKNHIMQSCESQIDVTVSESSLFDLVWREWIESGHEFGLQDEKYLRRGLDQILNFVMLVVKKK